ncbi:16010_t:CDS:1, partial [Racocetra persica]
MRDRSVSPPESRYMAPKRTTCTDRTQDQTSNPKKQEAHQQEYVTYVSTTSSNEKGLTGELTTMILHHLPQMHNLPVVIRGFSDR